MNKEETSKQSKEDPWAAAGDDLAEQRDMLRGATKEGSVAPAEAKETSQSAIAETAIADQPSEKVSQAIQEHGEIERILDIPLQLSVEFGRTRMLINDLLQLGQGSVIELSKLVGEPLEIFANERLVAKGEVVVVDEKFGVRITEISSPRDRIKTLG